MRGGGVELISLPLSGLAIGMLAEASCGCNKEGDAILDQINEARLNQFNITLWSSTS